MDVICFLFCDLWLIILIFRLKKSTSKCKWTDQFYNVLFIFSIEISKVRSFTASIRKCYNDFTCKHFQIKKLNTKAWLFFFTIYNKRCLLKAEFFHAIFSIFCITLSQYFHVSLNIENNEDFVRSGICVTALWSFENTKPNLI